MLPVKSSTTTLQCWRRCRTHSVTGVVVYSDPERSKDEDPTVVTLSTSRLLRFPLQETTLLSPLNKGKFHQTKNSGEEGGLTEIGL